MGYLHIRNLYADQRILLMRQCFALEKIHGTSANVAYNAGVLHLHSGGESAVRFAALLDQEKLIERFQKLGHEKITIFGEAYGGKQQGMAHRYGKDLRFVAFDVQIGDQWQEVPQAETVAKSLGIEFVSYALCSTDLEALNAQRDAPSEQAKRNGVEGDQPREGVVLRPLIELTDRYGERLISKHKRDEERETATPRKVVDPSQQTVLSNAQAIADEWVTPTRLQHVLDKLPQGIGPEKTREVISAMTEDVLREGAGEIVDSREARQAIGKKAAALFLAKLKSQITS